VQSQGEGCCRYEGFHWKHEEIVELQSDGKMRVLNNAIQAGTFGFTVVNVTLTELQ
jgi:hypothetical protein